MKLAVTGATGFVGRCLLREVIRRGWMARCWYRSKIPEGLAEAKSLEWLPGHLNDPASSRQLVAGCDAVVHAALARSGRGFRGAEGDLVEFTEANVVGSIRLFEAARTAGVPRVVYLSSCAVHERILSDRPLDETHPTWSTSHYGAHKAAVEQFVVSYGLGGNYPICALRPCGIYGVRDPVAESKWFPLIRDVAAGREVRVTGGGKEIHVEDVVAAIVVLLTAPSIAGETYNACDLYVSEHQVAMLAQEFSGSAGRIEGVPRQAQHLICTKKIQQLGVRFGGLAKLRATIQELVHAAGR